MKRTPWMFPIKGRQEKSRLVAYPSLRLAPPREGSQQQKPDRISYIKYQQLRSKLSDLPHPRVAPVQLSHASKTEAEKFSHLHHQSTANVSLGHKRRAGTPVLPLLYPEHRARTSVDLLQAEPFKAPLSSSLNLYEAPPDPSPRVETPSGPEHLPKILQACDYQNEELLRFSQHQRSTSRADHQDGALPCPYAQTKVAAAPSAGLSYETQASAHPRYQVRATALLAEDHHQHRAHVAPLPCLDPWSKATAVAISSSKPWVRAPTPKPSIYTSRLIASLKSPVPHARAGAVSSIRCNYRSKVANAGSPSSKPYVASTPSLIILGKAVTMKSSGIKLQDKAKPSAPPPAYNWHASPACSCPDHQTSLPSEPHATLRAPPRSEHHAKRPFGLQQKMKSSATSRWVKALPQNNYWAVPQPHANSEYDTSSGSNEDEESVPKYHRKAAPTRSFGKASAIPSGLNYDELALYLTQHNTPALALSNCNALNYICQPTSTLSSARVPTIPSALDRDEFPLHLTQHSKSGLSLNNCNNTTHCTGQAPAKQSSDRVSAIPSGLDHQDELTPNLTQQNISALSQNNCNNAPLSLTQQTTVPWVTDHWTEIQLTSDSWDTPLQIPDKRVKMVPNTNAREIPRGGLDHLDIQPVGMDQRKKTPTLDHQTPPLPVPNSKAPLLPHHRLTTPGSEFHSKDVQDARFKGSSKSLLEHWEKRFSQLKQVTPPRYQHKRAQSSPGRPRMTCQASTSQSFDQQAKTTEEPQNTRGMDRSALKCKSAFTEDKQRCESLPDHVLKPRIPKTKVSLSSDCHNEIQTKLQYQIPNVKNTKATWSLKYIKPYTIEGGLVPTNTMNDIISSIPQEKMKSDIRKQILLRRMRGSMDRSARHLLCGYKVCLVCASWAPNGCFHGHGSKYSCQARLLAIPMPVPGSAEEMGVKFVLQIPQSKTCYASDFDQHYSPSSTYPSPRTEATIPHHTHSLNKKSYPQSQSEESLTFQQVPPRVHSSKIIFDTDNKQWERSTSTNSEAFRRNSHLKNYSTREEPMKHERNVKSLLERFQRGKN